MARIATQLLRAYLSGGWMCSRGCLRNSSTKNYVASSLCQARSLQTDAQTNKTTPTVPFRKQLKDEIKKKKAAGVSAITKHDTGRAETPDDWELTVGIEIHAQLNTSRKLFSTAASGISDVPNSQVAFFDLAMPGSQPIFQNETLIPALRAALALNCKIQRTSRFDRKHYFHWDQPAGYQITQYYKPFAKGGHITLTKWDGIAAEDGDSITIGIKQVQMEQDTAKTIAQPGGKHLLDFNRVGLPLIEIITLPQIHHPNTAAAFFRKVQILLNAVDACVLGMESGGLRADVNVSVRRKDGTTTGKGHEYAGVKGLGQRTEIKNLSSLKAIKEAIIAERDRQIRVLEAGGTIEGETRGWTLGSSETTRLRSKEGEVDYRYMPDPDLAPVIIGNDLINYLKKNTGVMPDEELRILTQTYNLTMKDAMSIVSLNDGGRVEYFYKVVDHLSTLGLEKNYKNYLGRICANWVLHELGGLSPDDPLQIDVEGNCLVAPHKLARIIYHLEKKAITGKTAKALLSAVFEAEKKGFFISKTVDEMIEEGNLWFHPMSDEEYETLGQSIMTTNAKAVEQILKGQDGKIMFLVGEMMRNGNDGRVEPAEARKVIDRMINEHKSNQ